MVDINENFPESDGDSWPVASEPETSQNETASKSGPRRAGFSLRKISPKGRVIASLAILLVVGLATAGSQFLAQKAAESNFLDDLHRSSYAALFANDTVALAQGHAFCGDLKSGAAAQGFGYQKLAVSAFCAEFLPGFKTLPTAAEQKAKLLKALRAAGVGGLFSSDENAVAESKRVCSSLASGSKQQGPLQAKIAVDVYCPNYSNGFRLLKLIKVVGTFEIYEYDPYGWFPKINNLGSWCWGYSGFSDVDEGLTVTVKNSAGTTIAESSLGRGYGGDTHCTFKYKFSVLEGEDHYYVSIGKRGTMKYTEAELKIPGRVSVFLD